MRLRLRKTLLRLPRHHDTKKFISKVLPLPETLKVYMHQLAKKLCLEHPSYAELAEYDSDELDILDEDIMMGNFEYA